MDPVLPNTQAVTSQLKFLLDGEPIDPRITPLLIEFFKGMECLLGRLHLTKLSLKVVEHNESRLISELKEREAILIFQKAQSNSQNIHISFELTNAIPDEIPPLPLTHETQFELCNSTLSIFSAYSLFLDDLQPANEPSIYGEGIFQSQVYSSFVAQLKKHFTRFILYKVPLLSLSSTHPDPFIQSGFKLVQLLLNPPQELQLFRSFHKEFILLLRHLIQSKITLPTKKDPYIESIMQLVDELVHWMYVDVKLLQPMQDFIRQVTPLNLEYDTCTLGMAYNFLAFRKMRLSGVKSEQAAFDSLKNGDIPSRLWTVQMKVKKETLFVPFLRTPNITLNRSISAIFLQFLRVRNWRCEGRRHLYVNLMFRNSVEKEECSLIENLDSSEEDLIDVVTLDASEFWKRDKSLSITEFKAHLLNRMFRPNNCTYFWSKKLIGLHGKPGFEGWKESCKRILEKVHTRYFKEMTSLSVGQKGVFKEFADQEIIYKLPHLLRSSGVNVSCFATVDRAGAKNGGLKPFFRLKKKKPINRKHIDKSMAAFFGPAVLIYHRLPHEERLSLMMGYFQMFDKLQKSTS